MIIRLGSVYGKRLNLNGDQGNLLALRRYLNAAGYEVEVVGVDCTDVALSCHFLLLGHGSIAAMESLGERLSQFDWAEIFARVPSLAIATSAVWLSGEPVEAFFDTTDRVSHFEVATLSLEASGEQGRFGIPDDLRVLGYRNTPNAKAPALANPSGKLLTTMLHGPLLAKNPRLLDLIARAAVTAAGSPAPTQDSSGLHKWQQTLNDVASRIWALEAEGASYPAL